MPITIYGDGYVTGLANVTTAGNVVTNAVQFGDTSVQSSAGIGYSQTWQNVEGSRSLGVTYTNTTGKPIMVYVSAYSDTIFTVFYFTIDGMTTIYGRNAMGTGTNGYASASLIVPNGSTYRFTGGTIYSWLELR